MFESGWGRSVRAGRWRRPGRLGQLRGVVATAAVIAAAVPGAAQATGTSVGRAVLSSTSHAAGATEVTDRVEFVATSALTSGSATIQITAPAGVVLPSAGCVYSVSDVTSGASADDCWSPVTVSGNSATITVPVSVAAGDQVQLRIDQIANPAKAEAGTLSVSTSADTAAVSLPDRMSGATAVSAGALTRTSSSAGATEVSYQVDFVASSPMTNGDSTVDLTAPAGTVFPAPGCGVYVVKDLTTGQADACEDPVSGTGTNAVAITVPEDTGAGDQLQVTIDGIANPTSAGSGRLSISTSSDPRAVSVSDATTATSAVVPGVFTESSAAPGATNVTYMTTFTTTSGLNAGYATINLTAPAGTVFPAGGCAVYTVEDLSTGQSNACEDAVSGAGTNSVQITVPLGDGTVFAGPGDQILVKIVGVTNPTTPGPIDVSTTSDPISVAVPALGSGGQVSGLLASRSGSAVGATGVSEQIGFAATSGLVAQTSTITIAAPTGTTFPADANCNYVIEDLTTGATTNQFLNCALTVGGASSSTITLLDGSPGVNGITASPGDEILVTIVGVDNPSAAGSGTLSVSTTDDPTSASVTDSTAAASGVASARVTRSSSAAGATGVTYLARFVASQGLAAGSQGPGLSTITLSAPAGTVFPAFSGCNYVVTDLTNGQSSLALFGCPVSVTGAGSDSVTLAFAFPAGTISTGDQVLVTIEGVANPSAKGFGKVELSTSSNTKAVTLYEYTSPPTAVTGTAVTLSSPTAGASGVTYLTRFVATNGLTPGNEFPGPSTITLTAPAGTVFPAFSDCNYVVSDLTNGQSTLGLFGCPVGVSGAGTNSVTLAFAFSQDTITAGDVVLVQVSGVTNSGATGPADLELSTSSDPTTAAAPFTLVGGG